jgi:hypothetical protein
MSLPQTLSEPLLVAEGHDDETGDGRGDGGTQLGATSASRVETGGAGGSESENQDVDHNKAQSWWPLSWWQSKTTVRLDGTCVCVWTPAARARECTW